MLKCQNMFSFMLYVLTFQLCLTYKSSLRPTQLLLDSILGDSNPHYLMLGYIQLACNVKNTDYIQRSNMYDLAKIRVH